MATMTFGKAVRRKGAGAGEVLEIELGPREVRRLAGDHRGLHIACASGLLWVTQADDPDDYYLGAAEQFVVTKPGPVVVQGMHADA
jgi:hypothetical protein